MDEQTAELLRLLDFACEELEELHVQQFYDDGLEDQKESFLASQDTEGNKQRGPTKNSWNVNINKTKQSQRGDTKRKSFMGASNVRSSTTATPPSVKRVVETPSRSQTVGNSTKRETWCITRSMTSGKVPDKANYDRKKIKFKQEEKPKELALTILSAENLPKVSVISPYVIGFFDPELSFQTRIALNSMEPIWNEQFEIQLLESGNLHFTLWNNFSPKKQLLLGTGCIPFSKNMPLEDTVGVPIKNLEGSESNSSEVPCDAILHIKYSIFETDTTGDELLQLLIIEKNLMIVIYQWVEENRLDITASALVELFHTKKKGRDLLANIIKHPQSIAGLRTKTSVLRRMIGCFCKYSRDSYMNTLQPLLIQIEDNKVQLEVRPTYLHKQIRKTMKEVTKRQKKNKEKLSHYASEFIELISNSAHDIIFDLRVLCRLISDVFKEEPETLREVLGDILFQKYLCPVIASPVAFGLVRSKEPDMMQTQSYIVLAKLLVATATHKPFPPSNELACMNDFVEANYQKFDAIYKVVTEEHSAFHLLLRSTKQREIFRKHLETRFCTENLEFWEDIQEYKLLNDDDRKGFAPVIWKLYFQDKAERQLNVDAKAIQGIKARLTEAPADLFDDALAHVTQLLETDSFHKFRNNRRTTVISGQQIRQKVRAKCLADTCNFLVNNRGALKQFIGTDDTELCNSMKKLDEVLQGLSAEYNPHRDVEVLNRAHRWQKLPRAAWTVAASLLNTIIDLYKEQFSSTGSFTDALIKELASSKEFSQFTNNTAELQAVKVHSLSNNQKIAFWVNTFNLLTLHAYICIGQPNSKKTWLDLQTYSCYEIDGKVYSLLEIEHCVLRGAMGIGKWLGSANELVRPIEPSSERYPCICTKPIPHIYFLLCNGINSSPILHVFSPGSLQKDIELVSQAFLQSNVSLDLIALKEVC